MTPGRAERGSGTMLVAAAILVAGVVVAVVVGFGAALAASHRVRAAADLVAISAATEHAGGADACRAAARIAAANGVRLQACELRGDLVDFAVTVAVSLPTPVDWLPAEFTAQAHAGWLSGPAENGPGG